MCGIAGMYRPDGLPDTAPDILASMTGGVRHRGPDATGTFVEPRVALGHRRLPGIYLEGGLQPYDTNPIALIFNGEIYNYRELRAELESAGVIFQSQSDTEVLARGWSQFGRDWLRRLNGMFAFAVWEKDTSVLTLCRDPMGQKPLSFFRWGRGVVFGSEWTAVRHHPDCPKGIAADGLRKYLLYDYVPGSQTLVEGMERVEPGQWIAFGPSGVEKGTFFSFENLSDSPMTEEELKAAFADAVRMRLRSDVPLGIFLSGGIDSSLLVERATQSIPARDLHTFSIGFEDPSFDESSHAEKVARHFGTLHHHRLCTEEEMLRVLPRALAALDEPMADGSFLPTYLLSEFARETVTVALGGDGGDELFYGYPTFRAHGIARFLEWVPKTLWRRTLSPLVDQLPVSTSNISLDYQMKRMARGLGASRFARHFVWIGAVAPWLQRQILAPDVLASATDSSVEEPVRQILQEVDSSSELEKLSWLYCRTYLASDILAKVDRASMAHGLEARAPFMDLRVVRGAFALDDARKLNGRTTKVILREWARECLPPEIVNRPKKGFGMPIARWLSGPLHEWAREHLSPEQLGQVGVFQPGIGHQLLDEHTRGKEDHRKVLWSLLVFMNWWSRWQNAPTLESYERPTA